MRVLLLGASGFIGSSICGRLAAAGHDVVAVARSKGPALKRLPVGATISLDMARATQPDDWLPYLSDIDAVVNCAGVLQDSPRDSTRGVHFAGVAALAAACEQAGVRRVISVSAVGVEEAGRSDFSRSKLAGDEALMARDLDWVILRPSVVIGRSAYGGSALFRGLSVLPILPVPPGLAALQVVQLDDLVRTVEFFLAPSAPSRLALEIVGPDRLSFTEVVGAYRRWLGWTPAREIIIPAPLFGIIYLLGDALGWLGWRPPVRSTARREMVRGAVGDATGWTGVTGIVPQSLRAALAAEPASVQERWFAQLYLLKPLLFATLSLFFVATGVISLGPGWGASVDLMRQAGAAGFSEAGVIGGAVADIAVGLGMLVRAIAVPALLAALGLSAFYLAAATLIAPALWLDPLGPLVKVVPVMVLTLAALAIFEDR